ncbi:hypothetical protein D3C76_535960 [compost metagenome]
MNIALYFFNVLAIVALATFELQTGSPREVVVVYPQTQAVVKSQLAVVNRLPAQRPFPTGQQGISRLLHSEQTERFTF